MLKIYVWDKFIRFFHWSLLALVIGAYVTSQSGMQYSHEFIGYGLTALLIMRLIWGFMGSRYARFSEFVKTPHQTIRYLTSITKGQPKHYLGHNPAGGAMVLALLATLLFMSASGFVILATIEFEGPFVGALHGLSDQTVYLCYELHELSLDILFILITLHLVGVLAASLQHGENLPRSMITGYKSTMKEEE